MGSKNKGQKQKLQKYPPEKNVDKKTKKPVGVNKDYEAKKQFAN